MPLLDAVGKTKNRTKWLRAVVAELVFILIAGIILDKKLKDELCRIAIIVVLYSMLKIRRDGKKPSCPLEVRARQDSKCINKDVHLRSS